MAVGRGATGGFFREFREFALKGNVVDLAVAVIIGGAFGKIVSSFVEDVVMPLLINPLLSRAGTDWRETTIGPGVKIGSFLGSVVDFLIIALVLFLCVRSLEQVKRRLSRQEAMEAAEPVTDAAILAQERLIGSMDRLTQAIEQRN